MGALIEGAHFNARMAVHFRLFCHMSIAILELCNNLACMDYNRETDSYERRVLRNMLNGLKIYVPRFIPARCRWEPEYLEYSAKLNLATDDNDGRLCWVPFHDVMSRMFRFDGDLLPPLELFTPENPFVIVLQVDATGFGSLSISQMIYRNVYVSQSPRHCHLAALLRGGDDYEGTGRLHNTVAAPMQQARLSGGIPHPLDPDRQLPTKFLGSGDKMGILHINARSQMCTCRGTDQRLAIPPRHRMIDGFDSHAAPQLRARCVRPTFVQMVQDAHEIVPGETAPRPCRHPGCKFAHGGEGRPTPLAEYEASKQSLSKLVASDDEQDGKTLKKRRSTHLEKHGNQHEHKRPHTEFDMDDWILDLLHYLYLNIPKGTFKYTFRYKSPDEVLPKLSKALKHFKLPLDMRTQAQNAKEKEAWYTGGAYQRFVEGDNNSLGLARNIAVLLRIWADHQEAASKRREKRRATKTAPRSDAGVARAKRRTADGSTKKKSAAALGIGRASQVDRARDACAACDASSDESESEAEPDSDLAELKELTSCFETRCDQDAIKYIRTRYSKNVGSRLLRMAFAWEAQRLHYVAVDKVRHCDDTEAGKDAAALECTLTAMDVAATTYLVSNHNSKSWYYHNGVFKLGFDVRRLGSLIWGANCSSMEAHGASVLKRIAGTTVRICDKNPAKPAPTAPAAR